MRMVTARIMLASMMKIAPPNSSINVSLRRNVAVTPHNNYLLSATGFICWQQFKLFLPEAGSIADIDQ